MGGCRGVLPDLTCWRFCHGLSSLAAEGGGELGQIGDDAVDAGKSGGVGIGEGLDAAVGLAGVLAGPLGEADEEALVGGEAVYRFEAVAGLKIGGFGRLLPGDVGDEGSAEVGYVLSAGELAVDVDVVDDYVGGELVAEAVDAVLEAFGVVLRPPVLEVALGVELAALVVKGVGELVADGGAGVAVVGGVVDAGVVEGRLEDSGGKVDVVHLRVVVGVDGRR